jgi:hypothetical protein
LQLNAPPESEENLEAKTATVASDSGSHHSWEDDGYLFTREGRIIWVSTRICTVIHTPTLSNIQVEFSPKSPKDPFHFTQARKWYITIVAIFYTFTTSWNMGAYSVGEPSMERDTGGSHLEAAAGLGVYGFGFAIFPMVLSSGSEEFGRKPLYVVTAILFWLFYFPIVKYVCSTDAIQRR